MTLSELIASFRAKAEPIIGITGLSNIRENIADPLVQAVIHPLGGLAELWDRLSKFQSGWDNRTADCDCLERNASLIGETQRTDKRTSVEVVFFGADGAVIPAGTTFTDSCTGEWSLVDPVTIKERFAFGVAESSIGNFSLEKGELSLSSEISGVLAATNGSILTQGYAEESCEQFRARLLGQEQSPETEKTIIEHLESVADKAWFINDAPGCISPVSNSGFIVVGGSDAEIAEIIRKYAPMNYTRLAGNTQIDFDCEAVRFIRPCLIDVEVRYWGAEVSDNDIADAIEQGGLSTVSNIDCIQHAEFKLTAQESGDCPCDNIADIDYTACPTIESWQYPVFASAERMGDKC